MILPWKFYIVYVYPKKISLVFNIFVNITFFE